MRTWCHTLVSVGGSWVCAESQMPELYIPTPIPNTVSRVYVLVSVQWSLNLG